MDKKTTGRQKIDILVVEDSRTQAEHLRFILEGAGFGVLVSSNGKEALALLSDHHPDIALSDIVMPEMDGYELCRQIRAEPSFKEMPVILVTALSDPHDVIKGLEVGANNFITKPYDEKALLSRIEYLIANRNLRRTSKQGTAVDVLFSGQNYHITADRLQILDLLLSTYENANRQNDELRSVQKELTETNRRLEETVRELERARKEAESERRRLEAVMEALPVGVAITDEKGSRVRFNAAFERVWGGATPAESSLDQYAAKHAWWGDKGEAVTPDEWASALVVKKGTSVVGQLMEVERLDGSHGFVINSAAPIKGPAGEILGAAVAIEDITELHDAEKAVLRAKQEWERTFDAIPDLVAILDDHHRIVRVNRAMAARLGLTPEQCAGRLCHSTVHGLDCPPGFCPHVLTLSDGLEHVAEVHEDCLGGDFLVSTSPLTDERGRQVGSVHVARDITDRKRAEDALKVNEAIMEAFFDASPGILNIEDDEFRYIKTDRVTPTYFGLDRQSIVGQALSNLSPEFLERYGPMMRRVIETGEPEFNVEVESPVPAEAGEIAHWLASYFPIPLPENKRGIGVMGVEITAIKRAEEALREARDQLELRVAERTEELRTAYEKLKEETEERQKTEQQLRQAQKLEALGTLAGGIAHDFNNLLAAVIGFTELIKDQAPRESREHYYAERVLEAGVRGRELVRQMLTFSRGTEEEKKPLRLSSIVKESVKLLRASIPTTVDIRVNVKSESGLVIGDPVQVQQVLMNLATNAAFAMRETGGTLDLDLSDFSTSPSNDNGDDIEPGVYTKLVVRDTGTGIPRETIDKIFDPFFTTKKAGEGTGLGLSVVMGIVKRANGTITVDSKPGEGTTFTVYWPKAFEERGEEKSIGDEALPPRGWERILFVDDEEALAEVGEEILAGLGYDVHCCMSSREALALFRLDPSRFDLVITDQTMPEMTGIQLATELLNIRPEIPVILCTGFSHTANEESAKAAGIKGFAMKPLTKKEIAKALRRVLDCERDRA